MMVKRTGFISRRKKCEIAYGYVGKKSLAYWRLVDRREEAGKLSQSLILEFLLKK